MIVFTKHALIKLGQRNIKRELVLNAIENPDHFVAENGKKYAYKKFGKLYLKVILRNIGGNVIVITQYFTDKVK